MHNDDMAVLRQLVEVQRADVNALDDDGYGMLHVASGDNGDFEYATFLLGVPGIQVNLKDNSEGKTALHYACYNGHTAIVRELLQHPAVDVSVKLRTMSAALLCTRPVSTIGPKSSQSCSVTQASTSTNLAVLTA